MVLISSVAVFVTLGIIYRAYANWLFSPVGLFAVSFMLSYGVRIAFISTGLDSEYPDSLFRFGSPMLSANLYLIGFLAMCGLGLLAGSHSDLRLRFLFPSTDGAVDTAKAFRIATILTGIWFLIIVFLFARYGSYARMVRASKVDKEFAGLFFLLVFPTSGTITSILVFLLTVRDRVGRFTPRQRSMATISVIYALFNGVGVYLWGARSLLVLTAVQLVIGYFVFRPRGTTRRLRGTRGRVVIGILVAIGLGTLMVVGLRVYRDQALSGSVSGSIKGQTVVRQLSVAANTVHYDAYLLAVRDWPTTHRFRGGLDIYNGAVGVIPRALWPGKPTFVAPGAWFRQVYEPNTRNGWPMGAPGTWYLNFGRIGILICGLVTGIVLSAALRSMSRTRTEPLAFVMAFAVGIWVLGDGVDGEFVVKWAQFVLPMLLLIPLMRRQRRTAAVPVPVTV
ncbi:MAG: hypothetical protein KGR18_05300 [Acidobacteria bacterium]|nr:hypothetical protein [Acidobacteriota bacterium]